MILWGRRKKNMALYSTAPSPSPIKCIYIPTTSSVWISERHQLDEPKKDTRSRSRYCWSNGGHNGDFLFKAEPSGGNSQHLWTLYLFSLSPKTEKGYHYRWGVKIGLKICWNIIYFLMQHTYYMAAGCILTKTGFKPPPVLQNCFSGYGLSANLHTNAVFYSLAPY